MIDNTGVADESLHQQNYDYYIYDIFDKDKDTTDVDDMVWIKITNAIWRVRIMITPYSEMPCDANYLKARWLDTKTEYRVFKKKCHLNTQKRGRQLTHKIILVGLKWVNQCMIYKNAKKSNYHNKH